MSEAQEVFDILGGLSSPSADTVYTDVREYDTRDVVAAVGATAKASGGGSQSVKHVVVGIDYTDISTVTGFADLYLLPENETVLFSWVVVTTTFDGTADGNVFQGCQAFGPSGADVGSGATMGDTFNATTTNAANAADGIIGPDPDAGPSSSVLEMVPINAPVPGGGSVQLVIDFTGGNVAPYVQGTQGHLDYHLVIAVAA